MERDARTIPLLEDDKLLVPELLVPQLLLLLTPGPVTAGPLIAGPVGYSAGVRCYRPWVIQFYHQLGGADWSGTKSGCDTTGEEAG